MAYLPKSLILALMVNVVTSSYSTETTTISNSLDQSSSAEFSNLNSGLTVSKVLTNQSQQSSLNVNINTESSNLTNTVGISGLSIINTTNSTNFTKGNHSLDAIANTSANTSSHVTTNNTQCISIGVNPNYTKVVTTTNNSNTTNSTSNTNNSNNAVATASTSKTTAHGNQSTLTAKQRAYFSKPLSLDNTPNTDIPYDENGKTFAEFKEFLLEQAKNQGFSPNVLAAIQKIKLNKSVIRSDMRQYERIKVKPPVIAPQPTSPSTSTTNPSTGSTTTNTTTPAKPVFTPSHLMQKYLSLHITQGKVDRALSLLDNYRFMLDQISQTYHVPVQVIIGLWGMETSFGKNQGNYKLLDSLASLAYEGRRRQLFLKEFFDALRIIELNQFDSDKVLSSWAGAIGQIQFLPSSFLNYAVDGNGDGVVNIWYSTLDSFASIANYLHKNNWNDQIPWGLKVNLSTDQYLDFLHKKSIGIDTASHTLDQWQKLGIDLDLDQDDILGFNTMPVTTPLWLVVPDNEPDNAYLVTTNYKTYLRWNRSKYFAFANGVFADRIYESEQIRDKNLQDQSTNTSINN